MFNNYIEILMSLNYFLIPYVKSTNEPLCLSKHEKIQKCILLVTKVKGHNNYYYTTISSN